MKKGIILGGVIIIAMMIFIVSSSSNKSTNSTLPHGEEKEAPVVDIQDNLKDVPNSSNEDVSEATSGSYEFYTPEQLVFAETGNVVLFFHASWCPTCRILDRDIKANLSNIPADLKILNVDYDNSNELRKKYRVTTQHTLLQVDKDGNMISKWSGSPTLASLVLQLK